MTPRLVWNRVVWFPPSPTRLVKPRVNIAKHFEAWGHACCRPRHAVWYTHWKSIWWSLVSTVELSKVWPLQTDIIILSCADIIVHCASLDLASWAVAFRCCESWSWILYLNIWALLVNEFSQRYLLAFLFDHGKYANGPIFCHAAFIGHSSRSWVALLTSYDWKYSLNFISFAIGNFEEMRLSGSCQHLQNL